MVEVGEEDPPDYISCLSLDPLDTVVAIVIRFRSWQIKTANYPDALVFESE